MSDPARDPSPGDGPGAADEGPAPEDDLALAREQRSRRLRRVGRVVAAVVALGLLVPSARGVIEELRYRSDTAAVVDTLEGERGGADLADTVLLVRTLGCRPGTRGSGSAFVVETRQGPRLLTNRHVVDEARHVGVASLDGSTTWTVTGVAVSAAADVAVLEVEGEGLPPALTLAGEPVAAGDRVRLIGFPAARPFTTAGEVAAASRARLLLELEVDRGASGSPVVSESGRVVGQVHSVTADGLGVATPARRLPAALDDLRPASGC